MRISPDSAIGNLRRLNPVALSAMDVQPGTDRTTLERILAQPREEKQRGLYRRNPMVRWGSVGRSIIVTGVAIAVVVIVVTTLVVTPGSSQEVSEVQLGLRLSSMVTTTQPIPTGEVPVASGSAFGHPWLVSGLSASSGRGMRVGFSYRGSVLGAAGGLGRSLIPNPPAWARSGFVSSLDTASDGQRFLVAATNSTVTTLTVRAKGGTYVTTTALPERLGNTSFFVVSLGRERGPCYTLCQGSLTLSLSTSSGPTLINDSPSLVIHDYEGSSAALSAPVRNEASRQ
jgi:hypothetical protein